MYKNTFKPMPEDKSVLGPEEAPGPWNMCWHSKAPRVLCVLKPGHNGDHWYSEFTVIEKFDIKEK